MDIQDIKQLYAKAPGTVALCKLLQENRGSNIFLQGQQASATPLLFAAVATEIKQTFLFVLQDADEAGYFYHDLTQVMGTQNVLFFPSSFKRSVKYGQRDSANEILRTEVLARVSARDNQATESLLIVSHPEALSELVVSKQHLDERRLSLKTGQQHIDITDIAHKLREYGFQEVDYVYEPGQYSVRGSILDVYSFSCENPFRIDFFGREIDTIRTFEVQDQLSKDKLNEIEIVPELATLTTERVSFLNFLPSNSVMVYKDFAYIRDVIAHVYDEGYSKQAITEQLEGATEIEQKQIINELNKEKTLLSPSQFAQQAATFRTIEFGIHAGKTSSSALQKETKYDIIKFKITPQPLFHKNFDLLVDSLDNYILQGYKLYILADSDKQNQRLKDIFADMDSQKAKSIVFEPVNKTLHEGFADDDLKCCFFTDHQIFDRYHKYNLKSDGARAGKMALTMKELQEMEPGDFIVHVDFGIGKFGGLVRVPAGNSYQEMIRIIYQHNDKVDVSIHSLYKISKYRRSDTGEPPRLSTLGTGAWDRLKEKTKKRIKDIARDLIKLYAQRRHERGHAFSGDSYLQHELEASFLYEDTPDQSKATQDVKADMESQRPMDRLVCGDVGFGKTEVAVRAAFKSACDSKQVAVLVPTTVLAYQHYQTFKNRLKGMPVRVDYLSRARTAKQTKQVLTDLEDGKIDILIGTHKLLGKAVKWHDLGLLIIDEEQKFGVSTKEKLRKLKTNVDTLTMSATPIPRTLQFSLMGARDMSIIRTPPPNRYPIHTELATFSHEVIADAINFEMSRNGQVYFVHDRINGLQEIANLIHKYVPDCRIAIGHGQMPPEELEKVLMGFMNYDYDVLLSTTIVENGIDISNANTMIINDAHRFGLSDLHQMRGRVGRSNRKAFCYLLAPPKSSLTPEARRRLEALENFSELGSGFNLAMQDLDIRGAGNLLGAEQSGFMEDLGYETYQKILNQAVTELKNDEFQDIYAEQMAQGNDISGEEFVEDCAIESDLEMYFPDNYVPGSSERMLLYRELDNINDDNDLEAYRQRLIDRFGEIPHEGLELMQVVPLRRLGKRLGCEKISLKQGKMNMQFVANPESAYYQSRTFSAVINYVGNHPRRCDFKQVGTRRLLTISEIPTVEAAVSVLREMLKASTDATQA
ncbi:MAG: transcription-repair coupling factor [Prevotella salivae]|uniref:transcription-repair coupling factor n=1 Tax=Segatella salivae TaxID=228604 RepID=UPI001CB57BC7|nr:transcription-repair coupling factor [Segatella salivae]MBF1520718.1 transcription-repair coupling factor [Segatella salivae]